MHFELVRQVSIALENQPGALHKAAAELARHGINIHGLSVLDSIDQGVVREVLAGIGLRLIEAEVFEFELHDRLGRLAELCRALAENGVNIDYAYGSSTGAGQRMRMFLKGSPIERAKAVLAQLPAE
jgi:hypothetical protein